MEVDLRVIFSAFISDGTFLKASPFGSGHIHDTYLIETAEEECDNYILQRLNTNVFRKIPEMQENIERVTDHLRKKLSDIPGADLKREVLTLLSTKDRKTWISDSLGGIWRMFIFISDHRSYNQVDSPGMAYEGGRAIGRFQAMLSDLPGDPLHETIPYFHDVRRRLEIFRDVVKSDPAGRVKSASDEIDFALERSEVMKTILHLGEAGKIPLRITHNDTKFNNILLDKNDRALCLIDLDTVMPGFVHYDFGDAVRTAANTAAEDETDLSRVKMDMTLFEAFSGGYLSEAREFLNPVEKEYLAFAPRLITYIMGLRFLTDYLDGDHYFKIHHQHHNIQRTRAQFRLVESMEEQYDAMKRIIASRS